MWHRNVAAVSLIGAAALALGITAGTMANGGAMTEPDIATAEKTGDVFDEGCLVTGDGTCNCRCRCCHPMPEGIEMLGDRDGTETETPSEDGFTLRVIMDDGQDDAKPMLDVEPYEWHVEDDEADRLDEHDGLRPVAKREGAATDDEAQGDVAQASEAGRVASHGSATSAEATDVTARQRKAIMRSVTKRFGDSVTLGEASISPWDGGDGHRLMVVAYVDGKGPNSGKALSRAIGKLSADLAKLAGSDFEDVEILDVRMYGIDGFGGTVPSGIPSHEELEWAAGSSVDVPSRDGESIGDVNSVYVMWDGKPVAINMTDYGFSSLPMEE